MAKGTYKRKLTCPEVCVLVDPDSPQAPCPSHWHGRFLQSYPEPALLSPPHTPHLLTSGHPHFSKSLHMGPSGKPFLGLAFPLCLFLGSPSSPYSCLPQPPHGSSPSSFLLQLHPVPCSAVIKGFPACVSSGCKSWPCYFLPMALVKSLRIFRDRKMELILPGLFSNLMERVHRRAWLWAHA